MGSNAYNWIIKNLESALTHPDEAFDWIFMLKGDDWSLLEKIYDAQSCQWREACAYIFADGPIAESKPLLVKALFDSEPSVREQAVETIAYQVREYPDESNFEVEVLKKAYNILISSKRYEIEDIEALEQALK